MREAISKRFIEIRQAVGLTHQQLADSLYIARTTYTRYESGTLIPSLYTMNLLSNRLNISLDWLLLGKGSMFLMKKEKGSAEKERPAPPDIAEEEKEMLDMMKKTPVLRHKILLFFQEQKSLLEKEKN